MKVEYTFKVLSDLLIPTKLGKWLVTENEKGLVITPIIQGDLSLNPIYTEEELLELEKLT